MELHIQSEFDCVYLINGELVERADSLTMSEYDVAYITVFPLDTSLLPYTIKLVNADNVKNEFALGIRLSSEHYLLVLSPRRPIVYKTTAQQYPAHATSRIGRLFTLVKSGDVSAAYSMLTDELRASIDKKTLEAFFDGYERLVDRTWELGGAHKFYLITESGVARLHSYALKNEFIDDIAECDND